MEEGATILMDIFFYRFMFQLLRLVTVKFVPSLILSSTSHKISVRKTIVRWPKVRGCNRSSNHKILKWITPVFPLSSNEELGLFKRKIPLVLHRSVPTVPRSHEKFSIHCGRNFRLHQKFKDYEK